MNAALDLPGAGPADRREPDPACGDAVDLARAALVEQVGADVVGEHLGLVAEDDRVVSHWFACTQSGYPGWRWTVTIARADGADVPTVDEVVLLPGDDAILAPAWVPYRERIQPGDLSPGDILPTDEDDPRLVPGYLAGDEGSAAFTDDDVRELDREVGLGRARVLSIEGRLAASERWLEGEQGPGSPLAQSASHGCSTCGFLVRLAGPMSAMFGVCANEYANADGRVVALDHGCGAHSEAQLRKKQLPQPVPDPIFDTLTPDDIEDF